MADAPTFQELFRVTRDEMLSRNGKLTRAAIERDGADSNVIAAGATAGADECIGQLVRVEAGLYLDSATKQDLDRLVFDRYGLLRKPAAPAVGSVSFTTTALNPSAFNIPVNTKLQTVDGRQFITTASATFPVNSTGPVVVAVRSVLAGLDQQARANTITSIINRPVGSPGDLVVNNPLATVGADDAESDESLRDRARQFFTTARRGTLAAIRTAALAVPGVRTATAIENIDQLGRPARSVQLIVADAFTDQLVNTDPTPAAYQTQSQVLAATVFAALDDVRGAGIFVDVKVASVTLQGVQLGLRFQAGVDSDSVALQARAAVAARINALAPGADLTQDYLLDALRMVQGLIVTGQEIISPVGTILAAPLQVLRSSLNFVLAVSLQPTVALQSTTNPDAV